MLSSVDYFLRFLLYSLFLTVPSAYEILVILYFELNADDVTYFIYSHKYNTNSADYSFGVNRKLLYCNVICLGRGSSPDRTSGRLVHHASHCTIKTHRYNAGLVKNTIVRNTIVKNTIPYSVFSTQYSALAY